MTSAEQLKDAKESLEILEETERFLLEDVGAGGKLTLENTGEWADQLRETRRLIADQKRTIAALEGVLRPATNPWGQ